MSEISADQKVYDLLDFLTRNHQNPNFIGDEPITIGAGVLSGASLAGGAYVVGVSANATHCVEPISIGTAILIGFGKTNLPLGLALAAGGVAWFLTRIYYQSKINACIHHATILQEQVGSWEPEAAVNLTPAQYQRIATMLIDLARYHEHLFSSSF